MNLESIITNMDYVSQLAEAATYIDASGAQTGVRVVQDMSPDLQLAAAELGVRGVAMAFRVRVTELAQPCKGDSIEYIDVRYCVDGFERLNLAEWRLYVRT